MTWLGVTGGLLLLVLTPWYLRCALTGAGRPHPVSWGIWAALGILGTTSTASAGGGPAVIVLAMTALVEIVVFLVALRQTPNLALAALWPLLPAAIGAAVWLSTAAPLAGTLGVVTADVCGLWPTLAKTWAEPDSEPPVLWALGAAAFCLACISVSNPTPASLLYPVCLTAGNAVVAGTVWARRGRRAGLVASPWAT